MPFRSQEEFERAYQRGSKLLADSRPGDALPDLLACVDAAPNYRPLLVQVVEAATTAGQQETVTRRFAETSRLSEVEPGTIIFRIQSLRKMGALDEATTLISALERLAGRHPVIDSAASDVAFDRGEVDEALTRARRGIDAGPDAVLPLIRALLATGGFAEAHELASQAARREPHDQIWLAYRSTAARALRLDDPALSPRIEALTADIDLGLTADQLGTLAKNLRTLHKSEQPPHDQSVRGGTQTRKALHTAESGPLHHLFTAITKALDDFMSAMPAEADHPFFGRRRSKVSFTGSWSVRLTGGGHHISHIHPGGWLSSACYIAVPEPLTEHPNREGWLSIGAPPAAFNLNLPPLLEIAPTPGHLAVFPSYLWHGTRPFTRDAERLSVAFDAVPA